MNGFIQMGNRVRTVIDRDIRSMMAFHDVSHYLWLDSDHYRTFIQLLSFLSFTIPCLVGGYKSLQKMADNSPQTWSFPKYQA